VSEAGPSAKRAVLAACLQVNASADIADNLAKAGEAVRAARAAGAELICLPENVAAMVQGRARLKPLLMSESEHPAIPFFRALAKETGAWIVGGTLALKRADGYASNTCFVYAPSGEIAGRYDKIHLFDVDLPSGESYRESDTYRHGAHATIVETPFGKLGLTVCYDVRFPQLYRALAKAGAEIITVPSAFTVPTGKAHWHTLLRARAIETGCYILAPAQTGTHEGGRLTYGHALIVEPWGEVLADAGVETGFITARLDRARVAEVRAMVPSLSHDRVFEAPH
jgi:predicted amidohydrolase